MKTATGDYKLLYKNSVVTTPLACRIGRTIYFANSKSIVEIDIHSGSIQKEIPIPGANAKISHLKVLDNNNLLVVNGGRILRYYLPSGQFNDVLNQSFPISSLAVSIKGTLAFTANNQLYFSNLPP